MRMIIEVYPCYHLLLRSSQDYSHGIDDLTPLSVFAHIIREYDPQFLSLLAHDEPWDEEFEHAMATLEINQLSKDDTLSCILNGGEKVNSGWSGNDSASPS